MIQISDFHKLTDNLSLCGYIQCTGGFVRQQDLRLKCHGHGNSYTLAHSAGKLKRIAFHDTFCILQMHFGKHIAPPFPCFFFSHLFVHTDVLHKLIPDCADGINHRSRILKDHGNLCPTQIFPLFLFQSQ